VIPYGMRVAIAMWRLSELSVLLYLLTSLVRFLVAVLVLALK